MSECEETSWVTRCVAVENPVTGIEGRKRVGGVTTTNPREFSWEAAEFNIQTIICPR